MCEVISDINRPKEEWFRNCYGFPIILNEKQKEALEAEGVKLGGHVIVVPKINVECVE